MTWPTRLRHGSNYDLFLTSMSSVDNSNLINNITALHAKLCDAYIVEDPDWVKKYLCYDIAAYEFLLRAADALRMFFVDGEDVHLDIIPSYGCEDCRLGVNILCEYDTAMERLDSFNAEWLYAQDDKHFDKVTFNLYFK